MLNFKPFAKLISDHAKLRPQSLACVDLESERRWTWLELEAATNTLASWLHNRFGPGSGERIATLSKNRIELLVIQHACARVGLIYTPFNWRLSPHEVDVLIESCQAALIFYEADFVSDKWSIDSQSIETCLDLTSPHTDTIDEAAAAPDEAVTILHTSGTSGHPKGVILSSNNVGAGADNYINGYNVTEHSVVLCDMPLFHTVGLFGSAGVAIQAGATLLMSQGFEPSKTLSRLSDPKLGITHYFSVPQVAQMLRNHPEFTPEKLSSLTVYATGGAPNPPSQVGQFVDWGIMMSDGYGMSEICSTMGMPFDDPEVLKDKAGSCGILFKHSHARIVDSNGKDVPVGERGELWIKSPTVTQGYWNQPELSVQAFEDDWFKTGDIAKRDEDGFYFLVDRLKDMFISGGENVYPAEVENVIAELPDVAQSAVIGIPDEKWGEVGRAYIAPVEGRTVTEDDILNHCKDRLAGFKIPKSVCILKKLPSTGSGKVQKHLLPVV